MRFQGLNIPNGLIGSAQDGNLVVFAGAGVSMQDDVGMPSFEGLVCEIENRSGQDSPQGKTPLDRRLGKLYRQGVDVHKICSEIFLEFDGVFSELHKYLLSIFPTEKVRIVTTNFDTCFERAMEGVGSELPIYCAPAVPLGGDFYGIVHVHGSVNEPSQQILTDSDYGKAYVSKGWASKFLSDVFSSYDVLFVGYSCDDLLVDYLTRSLSADKKTKTYTLIREIDELSSWNARGIEVIKYDDHSQLPALFRSWGEHTQKDANQHREKVIELVTSSLMPKDYDEDYLLDAFSLPRNEARDIKLETLVKYAAKEEFLLWAAEKNLLDPLFANTEGAVEDLTISWVAESFSLGSFETILGNQVRKNREFSSKYLKKVLLRISQDSNCTEAAAGAWLPLIASANSGVDYSSIEICRLFDRFKSHRGLSRLLISMLISIKAVPDGGYYGGTPQLKATLVVGHVYMKDEVRENILGAVRDGDLGLVSELLISIEKADLFQRQCLTEGRSYGSMSFRRSAIESHTQDKHTNDNIFYILDVLRDAGLLLMETQVLVFQGLIQQCLSSQASLLRRLGLYYFGVSDASADDKCLYVIHRNLLDDFDLHHELFGLLKSSFPLSKASTKDKLLSYIISFYSSEGLETSDYSLFSICGWLLAADPNYLRLEDTIGEVREKHPEYLQREHPDFHVWMYDSIDVSEMDKESFEESSYEKLIRDLESPGGEYQFRSQYEVRDGIAKAAGQNRAWALEVLGRARMHVCEGFNETLIVALVEGISWCEYFDEDMVSAKKVLESIPITPEALSSISRAIEDLSKYANEVNWPSEKQEGILDLVVFFWGHILSCGEPIIPDYENEGWLMYSINHPISGLIEALISFLSYESALKEGKYQVPDNVNDLVSLGLDQETEASNAVRAILFSRITFLHSIAPEWVRCILLPLLNTSLKGADACWEGLSYQGSMTTSLWEDIMPSLLSLLQSDLRLHSQAEDNIAKLCAFSCFTYDENPLKSGLILKYLDYFVSSKSGSFIRCFGYTFENQKRDDLERAWDTWLSDFNSVVFNVHNQRYREYRADYQEQLFHWLSTISFFSETIAKAILEINTQDVFDGGSAMQSLSESSLDENNQALYVSLLLYILDNAALKVFDEYAFIDLIDRVDKKLLKEKEASDLRNALTSAHYLDAVERLDG